MIRQTEDYAPEVGFSRQLVVTAGYEYVLARDYSYADFQQGRTLPEDEIEILRPINFALKEPREIIIFDAYETDTLLADFLNIDAMDDKSILDFVTRYGLLWGNGERRYTTLDDESLWGFIIHEGNAILEMYKRIRAAQTSFQIAAILGSGLSEEDITLRLQKTCRVRTDRDQVTFEFSYFERFKIPLKALGTPYSENPVIDASYRFVFDAASSNLENFPLVLQVMPYRFAEKSAKRIRTYLKAESLMAVIWYRIAQIIVSGGNLRRCEARGCAKWFRYTKPNAHVCPSKACKRRFQRDAEKSRESGEVLGVPNACPTDTV